MDKESKLIKILSKDIAAAKARHEAKQTNNKTPNKRIIFTLFNINIGYERKSAP